MDFTSLIKNISSFIALLPTTVLALLAVVVILNLLGITIKGIIKTIVHIYLLFIFHVFQYRWYQNKLN